MQENAEADAQEHAADRREQAKELDADHKRAILKREEILRLEEREKELLHYRTLIQHQERDFESYRAQQKKEQIARERELQRELESREKLFADRERQLLARQKEVEVMFAIRQADADNMRAKFEAEIAARQAQLEEALQELKHEKERYSDEGRKKLERTSKDYVSEALHALDRKDIQYHRISKLWSWAGALSLLGGLGFFSYVTITSFAALPSQITWEFVTFSALKGLIAVALFGALAKYALLFSNSYMREALKNGDRRHAINFGKFYLESYGAAAEWSQIKEAFEHWNIQGSNAFSKSEDNSIDVMVLEKAAAIVERIGKALPAAAKQKSD